MLRLYNWSMNDPERTTCAHEIRMLVSRLDKHIHRDVEQQCKDSGQTLGAQQHSVLRLLTCQAYTLSELALPIGVEIATLVPVIDSLEAVGLARRGRDPGDRRRAPIEITQAGREMMGRIPYFGPQSGLGRAIQELGQVRTDQLIRELQALSAALEIKPGAPASARKKRIVTGVKRRNGNE